MPSSEGKYDLEERTFQFAKRTREFLKKVPRTAANLRDGNQLINSSGSVGANYIEANEAISDKDFLHRIKISRKEAKESRFWLRLIFVGGDAALETERGGFGARGHGIDAYFWIHRPRQRGDACYSR